MKTTPSELGKGQQILREVRAGTVVHVAAGSLRISGPWQWQDSPWRSQTELQAGAVQVFEQPGWCELTAVSAVQLVWHEPVSGAEHGLSLLHAGFRFFQRAVGSMRSRRRAARTRHAVDGELSSRV